MIALILVASISLADTSQSDPRCCLVPSRGDFAFASDPAFIALHEEPLPFSLQTPRGKRVSFEVPGEEKGWGYEVRSSKPTQRWIFVFQEWWGVNDYIKRESDRLQEDLGEVNILAIDLYDGKVAEKREEASALVQKFSPKRGEALIRGAIAYVGKSAEIGTIGWCFGGSYSLTASLLAGSQARACVVYYGLPPVDSASLSSLNGPVAGFFGLKDQRPSPDMVKSFQSEMIKAGKSLVVNNYDAGHAFANPSNPGHNKEFTADAWEKTIAFYRANLMEKH